MADCILANGTLYGELINTPLGMYYWKSEEWLPLLAESWGFITAGGGATPEAVPVTGATPAAGGADTFEVKLRTDATWSDGTPFTAQDVVDTLWCARIMSNTLWKFIDNAVAVDEATVHCHMAVPSTTVERYVIRTIPPAPSSVFGEFAQKARDLFEAGKTVKDPERAQLLEAFSAFKLPLPPNTGPYGIDENAITNAQLTLVKNASSVFVDNAHFDKLVIFNGETDTITAVVLNKDVDYATHAFAPASEAEFIKLGIRILRPPIYSGPALILNLTSLGEAFGDKRARQGLLTALNRDEIGFLAQAESGVPITSFAGYSDTLLDQWLTADEIAALNTYPTDADTAASLLEAAGWSKDGDTWKTPSGDSAVFELVFPPEYVNQAAAAAAVAEQLTAFGMDVKPRAVTFTQIPEDVDKGNFQLALRGWGNSSNPHPHFSFVSDFFVDNTLAVNNGGTGIGFPLDQVTDIAGEVDINQLVVESALGLDVGDQKERVATVAAVFNELLPRIPLYERHGNTPALEGVRVKAWPADDDPIHLNSPYADGVPTLTIYQGTLEPAD